MIIVRVRGPNWTLRVPQDSESHRGLLLVLMPCKSREENTGTGEAMTGKVDKEEDRFKQSIVECTRELYPTCDQPRKLFNWPCEKKSLTSEGN